MVRDADVPFVRNSPHDRRASLRRALAGAVGLIVSALTTYLLLDRNHAEELGGGSRAVLDLARGDRALPLALVTALLLTVTATVRRRRQPHGAGARQV